jgi:hypothetical protein
MARWRPFRNRATGEIEIGGRAAWQTHCFFYKAFYSLRPDLEACAFPESVPDCFAAEAA